MKTARDQSVPHSQCLPKVKCLKLTAWGSVLLSKEKIFALYATV